MPDCNFIKEETLAQVFSVNFAKFLRASFLQNDCFSLVESAGHFDFQVNENFLISDDTDSPKSQHNSEDLFRSMPGKI